MTMDDDSYYDDDDDSFHVGESYQDDYDDDDANYFYEDGDNGDHWILMIFNDGESYQDDDYERIYLIWVGQSATKSGKLTQGLLYLYFCFWPFLFR